MCGTPPPPPPPSPPRLLSDAGPCKRDHLLLLPKEPAGLTLGCKLRSSLLLLLSDTSAPPGISPDYRGTRGVMLSCRVYKGSSYDLHEKDGYKAIKHSRCPIAARLHGPVGRLQIRKVEWAPSWEPQDIGIPQHMIDALEEARNATDCINLAHANHHRLDHDKGMASTQRQEHLCTLARSQVGSAHRH